MKKNIIAIAILLGFTTLSCETKKTDTEISNEINISEDTLKNSNDTMQKEVSEFSEITLNKEFKTIDSNSKTFQTIINENLGKTIVIDVWASWCPDCIKGFPALEKVQEQYPNVSYVFISLDKTEEAWKTAIEKYDLKGSHFYLNEKMKGEFGKSINLDWIPRYIIVDKNGKIANYKSIVADDQTFLNTIQKLEQ